MTDPVAKAAIDLICEFEGFVDHWYPDPAHGWKVPTCCYGHTDAAGEPKFKDTKGKTFTPGEGRAILERDILAVAKDVDRLVTVELNPNQRGALVSFTFNLGVRNFGDSTLLKKLNAGDYAGAAAQFPRWNRAGGKVLKGLVRRRAAEAALFAGKPVGGQERPSGPQTPPEPSLPAGEAPGGLAGILTAILRIIAALFGRKP